MFPEPEAEAEAANGDAAAAPEGAESDAALVAEVSDEAAPPPEEAAPAAAPQPQRVLVEPEMGEIEALAAQSLYGFYPAQEAAAPPPPAAAQQQTQQQQQQPEPQTDCADADQVGSCSTAIKDEKKSSPNFNAFLPTQWSLFQPLADSPAAACVRSGSGPALPGLWTPLTPVTKAAAMQALFTEDTDALTRPPPPPSLLPPSLVHVFPATRCKDVLAATAQFDGDIVSVLAGPTWPSPTSRVPLTNLHNFRRKETCV